MWRINRCRQHFCHGSMWRHAIFLIIFSLTGTGCLSVAGKNDQIGTVTDLNNPIQQKSRRQQLEHIILAKLEFYATQYTDIDFVVLDSAGDVDRNMQVLAQVLGQDPIPLDYESTEDLRATLLIATLMRIRFLLPYDAGSSTFFKPGKDAVAQRKYVCVITLHPWAIARDDRAATNHLLDLAEPEFETISPKHYLDHVSHLQFAMDHEVYHMPISHREHWAEYYMSRDESGADAFGIIMNIASHGSVTLYARMLQNIRGLTLLLGDDVDHYTYPAIGAVLQMDPIQLAQTNVQERFQLATSIRNQVVGSYDDYIRYNIAAYCAARQLGGRIGAIAPSQEKVDLNMVRALVADTRRAYRSLTGRDIPLSR